MWAACRILFGVEEKDHGDRLLAVYEIGERGGVSKMADSRTTSLSPKVIFFLQDCGETLRVAIHDAERRATMRLRRATIFGMQTR